MDGDALFCCKLLALCLVFSAACRGDDDRAADRAPTRGVLVINDSGALPTPPPDPAPTLETALDDDARERPEGMEAPAEGTAASVDDGATAPDSRPASEVALQAHPATRPAAVSAVIPTSGGELVAGAYRAEIPARRSGEEAVVLQPLAPDDVRQPRPLSTILAAVELTPAFETTPERLRLTLPLNRPVEPGTTLQLLAFSRSMDAFTVVDETRVSSDDGEAGTVSFRTDILSQFVVIARPELIDVDCDVDRLALGEHVPDSQEREVVGLVEEEARMTREVALAVLSDLRHFPTAESIVFKNEERRATSGETHDGEDYLVDPRLAGPVIALGELVMAQWIDPIGGGPAFQLRVTDAFDASHEHSATSNHYRGRAVDLTLSPVPASSRAVRSQYYGHLARLAVCAGFDFVHFENRFHVHASSRPARLAYLERGDDGPSIYVSDVDGYDRVAVVPADPHAFQRLEIRSMDFSDDGTELVVLGRRKGDPMGFRIDLGGGRVEAFSTPDGIDRAPGSLEIDPSLRIEVDGSDRLVIFRPSDAPRSQRRGDGPTGYPLTADGLRGRLPTVWRD
jgi:hypothetical protein